ncbi:MAG: hypothetical protein IAF94_27040 [Pirellulaceae bacterium]|nr:hypothetical protein [Pirellulaceae bacterium]
MNSTNATRRYRAVKLAILRSHTAMSWGAWRRLLLMMAFSDATIARLHREAWGAK